MQRIQHQGIMMRIGGASEQSQARSSVRLDICCKHILGQNAQSPVISFKGQAIVKGVFPAVQRPLYGADFDDTDGVDDEDGVTLPPIVFASGAIAETGTVDVNLQNADPSSNRLDAWIDFNRDGDWDDSGEQIFTNFDLGTTSGVQTLNFPIPLDTGDNVINGETYARFRISTAGNLSPTGEAADGWRQAIYYHYYEYPQPHRVAPHYGVRTERHKLIYYYRTDEWELFDLLDDPQELRSVYADPERAELVSQLKAELRRLRDYYGDATGVEFSDG